MRRIVFAFLAFFFRLHGSTAPFVLSQNLVVLEDVTVNGCGPFRFVLDTGAESSTMSPDLATRLGIVATGGITLATLTGKSTVPMAQARIGIAGVSESVEVLVTPLAGFDGVIGQSFLSRHDYLIDYDWRQFTIDPMPSEVRSGKPIKYRLTAGRMAIPTLIPSGRRFLVLDSGASALVLYRESMPSLSFSSLGTMLYTRNGSVAAPTVQIEWMNIDGHLMPALSAAILSQPRAAHDGEDGLLPAHFFSFVYVENTRGLLTLGNLTNRLLTRLR